MFNLFINIDCEVDKDPNTLDSFCKTKPVFRVPSMGCPSGQVMVAIDQCGKPQELDGYSTTTAASTLSKVSSSILITISMSQYRTEPLTLTTWEPERSCSITCASNNISEENMHYVHRCGINSG